MKKFVAVLCALVMLFSLTACVRMDITLKVNKDGTMDISELVAYSSSLSGEGETGLSEEEIEKYEDEGYKYKEYVDEEDGYVGYTLTRKNISPDELSDDDNSMFDDDSISIDGRHVVIDIKTSSDDEMAEAEEYGEMIKQAGGYVRFNLELPVKPSDHNANSVSDDGKTLTWDLTNLKEDSIYVEFDMPLPWYIFVIIAVVAVLVILAVVLIIVKSTKKKGGNAAPAPAQFEPAVPEAAAPAAEPVAQPAPQPEVPPAEKTE